VLDQSPQSAIRNPQSRHVSRVRFESELNYRFVFLFVFIDKLSEPRRIADQQDQHAGRERVEGARVPDALCAKDATDAGDDIVRCQTGGFVDNKNAIHRISYYSIASELLIRNYLIDN